MKIMKALLLIILFLAAFPMLWFGGGYLISCFADGILFRRFGNQVDYIELLLGVVLFSAGVFSFIYPISQIPRDKESEMRYYRSEMVICSNCGWKGSRGKWNQNHECPDCKSDIYKKTGEHLSYD